MREVYEEVVPTLKYSITTVGKYLQIMTEKGLVQAEQNAYAWRYRATYSEEQVQRHLASTLLKKAFGGSPLRLINQLLASNKTSAEELAAIKRLCDQHKKT
jgi:predicted transcriptional regulator